MIHTNLYSYKSLLKKKFKNEYQIKTKMCILKEMSIYPETNTTVV